MTGAAAGRGYVAEKVAGGNCGEASTWGSGLNVTQSKKLRRGSAGAIGGGEAYGEEYTDWLVVAGAVATLTGPDI